MKTLFNTLAVVCLFVTNSIFAQTGSPLNMNTFTEVVYYNFNNSTTARSDANADFNATNIAWNAGGVSNEGFVNEIGFTSLVWKSGNWSSNTEIDLGNYIQFTITPTNLSGTMINQISHLSFQVKRGEGNGNGNGNSGGPTKGAVRSSADGYAANLLISEYQNNIFDITGSIATITVDMTNNNNFYNLTGPVTFRIYGFAAGNNQKHLFIDNVNIYGEVVPAPPVMPVQLISFDAVRNNSNVILTWATAMEENNDYFTIERSANGVDFEAISRVLGAGNSTAKIEYKFTDEAPVNGTAYYRLKQTDYDGTYDYSKIVKIEASKSTFSVNVYPVQAVSSVQVSVSATYKGAYTMEVIDMTGRVVGTEIVNVEKGFNTMSVEITNLTKGMYLVRMTNGNEAQVQRIIKQ